jgi:hypothetical protein
MANPFLPLMPANYSGDTWNVPPPMLPQPDIQAEMIPATAPSNAVMPDEVVGAWTTPYLYATSPLPELTYNPWPVAHPEAVK